MSRARPTALGAALLLGGFGLAAVGVWTSDNALVLVAAALLGPFAADAALGRRALDRVEVRRELPDPLFADVPADGRIVVTTGAAAVVQVRDVIADAQVTARGPGTLALPVRWRFPRRGAVTLDVLVATTSWPLGLWWRNRTLSQPVTLFIAPKPRCGELALQPDDAAIEGAHRGADRVGDPRGLRPFTTGDRARDVHWPTSARMEELHVVDRAGAGDVTRLVSVRTDVDADRLERDLEAACGALLEAASKGPVALIVDEERVGPGVGGTFRRVALDRLATVEARGAGGGRA
jgi:uncharacterized protein (DUF58 family)